MDDYVINTDSNSIDQYIEHAVNDKGNKKIKFDEKNYLNTRLNENETQKDIKIRLLPLSETDGNIFLPINVHNLKVNRKVSNSGYKSFICLNDPHLPEHDTDGCPICNQSKKLFKEANETTDEQQKKVLLKTAYELQCKKVYIARVIERGKEDEGVKFWRFNDLKGIGIYDKLIKLYVKRKEEYRDAGIENFSIFDLKNGKDIIITLKFVQETGKTQIDIMDAGVNTPLSKDINLANSWICDSKKWYEMYRPKSSGYLNVILDGGIPYYDEDSMKWINIDKKENE